MSVTPLTFIDKTYFANKDTTISLQNGNIWTLLSYNIRSASDLLNNTAVFLDRIARCSTHIIFNVLAFDFDQVKEGFRGLKTSSRVYSYQLAGKLIGMVPIIGQIFAIIIIKRCNDATTLKEQEWTKSSTFNLKSPETNTCKRAVLETLLIPAKLLRIPLNILVRSNIATSAVILNDRTRLKEIKKENNLLLSAIVFTTHRNLVGSLKEFGNAFCDPIQHLLGKAEAPKKL